ncbi:MAG TPA: hypothetical protein DHN29_08230 [Cytophagales bacterium]|nr:hypothetical protein [Cytophagales bacterium]
MKKVRIKVEPLNWEDENKDCRFEVNAFLVGGPTGVFAAWKDGNCVRYAEGDDGYWREKGSFNEHWLPRIIGVLSEALKENEI